MERRYLPSLEGKENHKRNTELMNQWFSNLGNFQPSPKDVFMDSASPCSVDKGLVDDIAENDCMGWQTQP
jgi:hypothetical protein